MIDGEAEADVVSKKFVAQHNIPLTPTSPIPVLLANGSTSITSHTASINFQRFNYSDTLHPIVYDLGKYDLILGKPWLTKINPSINWRTNNLYFTFNGLANTWTCTGHTPSSITHRSNGLVLSNVHFASVVAQPGSEVYLATVRLEKKDNKPPLLELPPEIIPIVHKEFSDVFPTSLPSGLPPD